MAIGGTQFYTFVCVELRQGFHWRLPTGPQSGGRVIDATKFLFKGADLVRIEAGKHQRLVLACLDLSQAIQGIGAIRLEAVSARRPLPPFGIGLSFGAAKEPGTFDPGSASKAAEWLAELAPTGAILAMARVAQIAEDLSLFPFGFAEYGEFFNLSRGRLDCVHVLTHPLLPLVAPVDREEERRHNLPPTDRFFIGRESELEDLRSALMKHRCVEIVGPSGCGKSALICRLAWEVADDYRDGVRFVDLSGARTARDLSVRMFDSLNIPTDHLPAPKLETIRRYFAGRKHLLVFDAAEGVLPHLRAILRDLMESSGPRALIASMKSMKSSLALTYPLENMAVPSSMTGDEFSFPEYDSCALFIDGLHRVRPSFNPDLSELRDIGEICRFLGGHPLGLILHAQRFRSESLAEIRASMLTKRQSLLLPGLERSVEITLKTLSGKAIRLLEQASIFESSWTRLDLQALTGQSMSHLRAPLEEIQQSLLIDEVIQESGSSRLCVQLHIRESVLKRLRKEGRIDAVRERHLLWLLNKFGKAFSEIHGLEHARHRDSLDGATHELAAAMMFLVESRTDPTDFISSLELSWLYWSQSNRGQTVIELVKSALKKFKEPSLARGRLYSALSIYQTKTGSAGKAVLSIRRAIELASSAPDQLSKMYNNLGGSLWAECRFDEALVAFHRAKELAIQTGQLHLLDDHLGGIANSLIDLKRCDEAIPVLDELVERTKGIDDILTRWSVMICQVQLACGLAQFDKANALLTELFQMSEAQIKEPSLVGRVHLWNAVVRSATGDPFESLVSVVASRILLNMLDLRPFKVNEWRLRLLEECAFEALSDNEEVMARLAGQLRVSHLVKST